MLGPPRSWLDVNVSVHAERPVLGVAWDGVFQQSPESAAGTGRGGSRSVRDVWWMEPDARR
jgi:hypothetical protein